MVDQAMHVPDELVRSLRVNSHRIKAELVAKDPINRSWVHLSMKQKELFGKNRLKNPEAPAYTVFRFEISREIVEDDTHSLHEPDFFEHIERFETQDIGEAFEKAAEYESDWSKWGTSKMHPISP